MRLNISAWAIRKPITSIVLFLVLMILGLVSFRSLPITQFPNIDIPIVAIQVTQAGAAPSELQTQVTKVVEDAVAGVKGVKHIISTISEGVSATTIEFRLEVNVDRAVNDVKDAIAKVRVTLPRTIDEPIISRVEIAGLPIMVYGASAPAMTPEDLSWLIDDVIARQVQGVKGVGGVERLGGVAREIRVTLKPDRLLALGITAADVNRQLRLTSADMAGGRGELGGQEQSIRTLAGAASLDTLAQTSIVVPGNRKVRLDELATLVDGSEEPRTFARFNGEPVVAFAISRATGASDAEVASAVARKIADLGTKNPGVRFDLIDTSVINTVGNYHSAMLSLIEGAALAVIVVFLFLRDWRATLIASIALPLSVLPTFWVMSTLGFSLNAVSLLAITLVTGILVDDAIVEIENIVRHMRMGKSAYRAALEAADEIGLAVIAITATIIAIFAPVSFMSGIAGQYFKQFGLTIAAAVFMSLLVARLITPLLAAYFLRDHGPDHEREGPVMRAYTRVVAWSVRHKYVTLVVGLACFAGSIMSTGLLPAGFLPAEDAARTIFVVELPPGARLADTTRVTDGIVDKIRALPEVRSVFVDGGRQLPAKKEVRLASFTINLTPKNARHRTQKQLDRIIGAILREEPDIRFWSLRDSGQRDLALIISGPDLRLVSETAAQLQREAATVPHLVNVLSTAPLDRTEIRIRPKAGVAADLGVSTDLIAETVRVGDDRRHRRQPRQVQRRRPAGADTSAAAPRPARRPVPVGEPESPGEGGRLRSALHGGRSQPRAWSHGDRPLRPLDPRGPGGRHGGLGRAGHPDRIRDGAADREEPAAGCEHQPDRRCGNHGRGVRRVRPRHGRGPDDGVRRSGAAVRKLPSAAHHPVLAAPLHRRCDPRSPDLPHADLDAGGHRHPDAHGRGHQERDHAGGFRHRGNGAGRGSRHRDHRCGA